MEPIPAIILAGSDRDPAALPEAGRGQTSLSGYKGLDLQLDGRPLVRCVVDRVTSSGSFDPVYVAGPARVFRTADTGANLVDCEGKLSENVRCALAAVCPRHPGAPLAFLTCDVLPTAADLETAVASYRREAPCAVFFPLVRVPQDPGSLGVSFWKPSYRIVARKGEPATGVLPGHLVVVEPDRLRVELVCRLLDLAYQTRNQSLRRRRPVMIRGVLRELMRRDVGLILHRRLPRFTWTVLRATLAAGRELERGSLTRAHLEATLSTLMVNEGHGDRYVGHAVRVPIIDGLSLALDIDTEEEAQAAGAFACRDGPAG